MVSRYVVGRPPVGQISMAHNLPVADVPTEISPGTHVSRSFKHTVNSPAVGAGLREARRSVSAERMRGRVAFGRAPVSQSDESAQLASGRQTRQRSNDGILATFQLLQRVQSNISNENLASDSITLPAPVHMEVHILTPIDRRANLILSPSDEDLVEVTGSPYAKLSGLHHNESVMTKRKANEQVSLQPRRPDTRALFAAPGLPIRSDAPPSVADAPRRPTDTPQALGDQFISSY